MPRVLAKTPLQNGSRPSQSPLSALDVGSAEPRQTGFLNGESIERRPNDPNSGSFGRLGATLARQCPLGGHAAGHALEEARILERASEVVFYGVDRGTIWVGESTRLGGARAGRGSGISVGRASRRMR